MFLGRSAKFNGPSGIDCVKLDGWDDPDTDADDDELFVVLVNRGRDEILFNNSMTSITRSKGDSEAKFIDPKGVAVDRAGNVYVTDTKTGWITKLRFDEKHRLKFVSRITGGAGSNERFLEPVGLCASLDERLYVTDRLRNEIMIFSPEDLLLQTFGGSPAGQEGVFQPIDIDVLTADDPWNFFKKNSIYVLDMNGGRIQKLSADGEVEALVSADEVGIEGVVFSSIAADYYSQIFATDSRNHCVHKFDRNLKYLTTFGSKGTGDRQFLSPAGITIWKRFGQVFIADSVSVQYLWIGTDVFIPEGEEKPQAVIRKDEHGRYTINVTVEITEPSEIYMHLEGADKEKIPVAEWRRYFPKTVNLTLPLTVPDEGGLAGSKIVLKVRATYSSKQSFEKKLTLPVKIIY
jgi:hypothetical protein